MCRVPDHERAERETAAYSMTIDSAAGKAQLLVSPHVTNRIARRLPCSLNISAAETLATLKYYFESFPQLLRYCLGFAGESLCFVTPGERIFTFDIWQSKDQIKIYVSTFWAATPEEPRFRASADNIVVQLTKEGHLLTMPSGVPVDYKKIRRAMKRGVRHE